MKKILSAILAGAVICTSAIAFAGCGSSSQTSAKSEKTDSSTTETASNGELHMATNAFFEPYEYYKGDKIVGIDAELADKICEKLGYKSGWEKSDSRLIFSLYAKCADPEKSEKAIAAIINSVY
jgi:polar amino acid transport system substrate-binding protein